MNNNNNENIENIENLIESNNFSNDFQKKVQLLIKSLYGYTDENNPFGDPNLSTPFVWVKKSEDFLQKGFDPSFLNDEDEILLRIKNSKDDIDEIKKLKNLRETLKQINKDGLIDEIKEQDDIFLINQEKLRNEIRLKTGREKPIDFLFKTLKIYKNEIEIPKDFNENVNYKEPYNIFNFLDKEKLNELFKDISFQANLNSKNEELDCINYWNSLLILCADFINKNNNDNNNNEENKKINKDVFDLIKSYKTIEELNVFEKDINKSLENEFNFDEINFYKECLNLLKVEKSKKIIEKMYNNFVNENINKINKLKENNIEFDNNENKKNKNKKVNLSPKLYESDDELRKVAITEHDYLFKLSENRKKFLSLKINEFMKKNQKNKKINNETKKINKNIQIKEEQNNSSSSLDLSSDSEIKDFYSKISEKKNNNLNNLNSSSINNFPNPLTIKESRFDITPGNLNKNNNGINENNDNEEKMTYINISNEDIDNENIFNDTIPVNTSYDWINKYKPIKPRYANRVTYGYEWNKFNQVHYTQDNPPPKVIQGYKFNIFYPYLIDKTKTPQYTLERSDIPNTCIIRFRSGAPYEDIAFRIVNREWDMTDKAGFRNTFDKGILKLYFKFKRYRYKR